MDNSVKESLRRLLTETTGAFDPGKKYVQFDKVWRDPGPLKDCAELVYQFLLAARPQLVAPSAPDRAKLVILSPDAIRSNIGTVPVGVLVADRIGCRFAVWKEMADLTLGTSAILGSDQPDLRCIVLQDVISRGYTALRIAPSIKERRWHFDMFVGIVLNNKDESLPAEENVKKLAPILDSVPELRYMISARELVSR